MIGQTLGHYTILAKLGEGGMGEVYRARDDRLGREVALKVLPRELARDPVRLARLEREARTAAGLSHPNIVTLHAIEEVNGVRFLTMELVDGETLDRKVLPGGMPLAGLLRIAVPLSDALAAAHAKGVIHRDLKPANIMVTPEGRVKVLDFGLAKPSREDEPLGATQAVTMNAPISEAGQVVGTVPYMAPEQIRGEPVDARADLFSFGVILYELATGQRPFRGASSADVSSSILRDVPPPVRAVRAELPRDLERVVRRCLEKDLERRFQTAKDVRNELEMLERETLTGGLPGVGPRVGTEAAGSAPAPLRPQAEPPRPNAEPPRPKPKPAESEPPSIAVLPFVNRSPDPEDEYFSDGLADELLSVLVKLRGVRVAARTSSAAFKGKQVSIEEAGRALKVATVVEGSVRKAGNRVRVTVQLVKVADGFPLWSETYDRTLEDIFAVQDDIAQSVVKELRTTLLGESRDSSASREARAQVAAAALGRGENAEAHRLYLQGRHFIDRFNETDVAKGIEYLRQAVALDPGHARAWAALSYAFGLQGGYGWVSVHEGWPRAREAAERALAIEPDLAEGHVMLSRVQRIYEWDWKGARASSARALELAPESLEVIQEAGELASYLGRSDEAVASAEKATALDPLNSTAYSRLGRAYFSALRLEEAEAAYLKALELAPQRIACHSILASIVCRLGRLDEALTHAEQEPAEFARLLALGDVYFAMGREAESQAALEQLKADHAEDSAIQIAVLHAIRGEVDDAFDWMNRAVDTHDSGASMVKNIPVMAGLHRDPRWAATLARMGMEP